MLDSVLQRLEVGPRKKIPRPCGDEEVLSGRNPSQMGWYSFLADKIQGQTVLDVGCGSGEGLKLLAPRASYALGIDLDGRLIRSDVNVEIRAVTDVADKSFDVVVCLDVIEHIEADREFVAELFRVARHAVFVSTPNYAVSFNRHPYHIREYTPMEFASLFDGYGEVTLYGGSAKGHERAVISRRLVYYLVAELYRWKPSVIAKVMKRLFRVKMWKHNAAWIRLPSVSAAVSPAQTVGGASNPISRAV